MAPLSCGCDRGISHCATALRLWAAYVAAEDAVSELRPRFLVDPLSHDRWSMAVDDKLTAQARYERHVSGEDLTPEPRSLKADRLRVVS